MEDEMKEKIATEAEMLEMEEALVHELVHTMNGGQVCPVCMNPALIQNEESISCQFCNLRVTRKPSWSDTEAFLQDLEAIATHHSRTRHQLEAEVNAGFNESIGLFLACSKCDEIIMVVDTNSGIDK